MKEIQQILTSVEKYAAKLKISSIEILAPSKGGGIVSAVTKTFVQGFEHLSFENIGRRDEYLKDGDLVRKFEEKSGDKTVFCAFTPIIHNGIVIFGILYEGAAAFPDEASVLFETSCVIAAAASGLQKSSVDDKDREIKSSMMSMRQMQAMLFPSFDNVDGLDIGAVYLPSKLMSGNFIDAFFLNDDTYQAVSCVVSGYDATASFIGAAVRTLVKSLSSAAIIPSGLVELIMQKLVKIVSGVNTMVKISVYQINVKTGRISMSSYGSLDTLLYVAKKKNAISLNDTQIGKDLSKRTVFKDIIMILESGDSLLFYSQGVLTAESEDGSQAFGMSNLWDKYKIGCGLSSAEHVQSISQSIFEFINYSPIKDDILVMRIKKN